MPRLIHGPGDVPVKYLNIDVAVADTELLAAVANTRYCVHAYVLSNDAAAATKASFVSDGTGDTTLASFNIWTSGGPIVAPWNPAGWFITGVNEALDLRQTTIDDMDGHLVYTVLTGDVT